MKKILLLGGSAQQVIAIDTAKRMGYYTVLCDYLMDNPGQYHADKFYLVSTTDKDAVLEVAKKEDVSGVLAYASDPAAPTAAYVAEKLGLPGNPYESVNILCNKNLLREFLASNGFAVPKSVSFSSKEEAIGNYREIRYPIIIKPVDSSGSKGITVLKDDTDFPRAVDFAFSFSRAGRIIIEEYIEKAHPYLIGGDIFIADGKVCIWGLLNCHRDNAVNPLVPVGKSYPVKLSEMQTAQVKEVLQRLVSKLNIRFGAMNVELIIGENGQCYIIDAGPRAGGNMIPDLLGMIFNTDVVEMSVRTAMELNVKYEKITGVSGCLATHNLHSAQSGIYKDIKFDDEIEKYIIKKFLYKKEGDEVGCFENASYALGVIFMRFESEDNMMRILTGINDHIKIELIS